MADTWSNTTSESNATAGEMPASERTYGHAIVDRVREGASSHIHDRKEQAADGLASVAQAVRDSSHRLRDQQHETAAEYFGQAADRIDRLAQQLHDKDLASFVDDVERFARQQPAVFVGSALAIGFIAARYLKSTSETQRRLLAEGQAD